MHVETTCRSCLKRMETKPVNTKIQANKNTPIKQYLHKWQKEQEKRRL